MDFHGWIFQDGLMVYFLYMAEPSEYNIFSPEFEKIAKTFFFKPQTVQESVVSYDSPNSTPTTIQDSMPRVGMRMGDIQPKNVKSKRGFIKSRFFPNNLRVISQ